MTNPFLCWIISFSCDSHLKLKLKQTQLIINLHSKAPSFKNNTRGETCVMYCQLTPCQLAHSKWKNAAKHSRASQSLKAWGHMNLLPVQACIKHYLSALCWHSPYLEKITVFPFLQSVFHILNWPKRQVRLYCLSSLYPHIVFFCISSALYTK